MSNINKELVIREMQKDFEECPQWDYYRNQALVLAIGRVNAEPNDLSLAHYVRVGEIEYNMQHDSYMATGHAKL